MPKFSWSPEKIVWYQRAVAFYGFDRILADFIEPWLTKGETVCDMGCGTGYLAMELARRGYGVTAMDESISSIRYLREEAARRGLNGLEIRESSWFDLPVEPMWDTIVLTFTGSPEKNAALFRKLARKRVIFITKANRNSHIRADGVARFIHASREEIEAALQGCEYESFQRSTQFGQPFTSLEDARAYVEAYDEITSPQDLEERMLATGREDYPYVLPNEKSMRIFIVKAEGAES